MTADPGGPSPEHREVIWARPARASKGPVPSTSRDDLAEAAVRLADAEGMDAVSMRRIAAALGIAAASLYGYVDNKDELYDLMVDRVEGEQGPPPAVSGDARGDLARLAHRVRAMILRHPWLSTAAAERPHFGPNSLAWTEFGFAAMDHMSIDIDEILVANETLQSYVRGFTARELAETRALHRAGLTVDQWAATVTPYIRTVIAGGKHPRFARVFTDAGLPHADDRQDRLFRRGLAQVLDGMLPPATAARASPPR